VSVQFRLSADGDLLLAGELHEVVRGFDDSQQVDDERQVDDQLQIDDEQEAADVLAALFGIDAVWVDDEHIHISDTGHLVVPELIEDPSGPLVRIAADKTLTIRGDVIEEGL